MSNCDFVWELAFQEGVKFFRWDWKTLYKKIVNMNLKQKIIPNVVSAISDFWSPTLTTFRQSVFVSLFFMVSQTKNDSKCNFYNFSLLAPYPNNFLVVCICVLSFHGIYSPHQQIFFLWRAKKFFCVLQLGAQKISNFWGPFCNSLKVSVLCDMNSEKSF